MTQRTILEPVNQDTSMLNSFMNGQNDHDSAKARRNVRKAVRYIRKDIKAALTHYKFFRFNKLHKVKLHDLSSTGALISTDLKIPLQRKVTFIVQFKDRKRYMVRSKVVRRVNYSAMLYGLKFENSNTRLADHILETQTELIIR